MDSLSFLVKRSCKESSRTLTTLKLTGEPSWLVTGPRPLAELAGLRLQNVDLSRPTSPGWSAACHDCQVALFVGRGNCLIAGQRGDQLLVGHFFKALLLGIDAGAQQRWSYIIPEFLGSLGVGRAGQHADAAAIPCGDDVGAAPELAQKPHKTFVLTIVLNNEFPGSIIGGQEFQERSLSDPACDLACAFVSPSL